MCEKRERGREGKKDNARERERRKIGREMVQVVIDIERVGEKVCACECVHTFLTECKIGCGCLCETETETKRVNESESARVRASSKKLCNNNSDRKFWQRNGAMTDLRSIC